MAVAALRVSFIRQLRNYFLLRNKSRCSLIYCTSIKFQHNAKVELRDHAGLAESFSGSQVRLRAPTAE
jgi:hypothetical protein